MTTNRSGRRDFRWESGERGATAVLVALLLTSLIAVCALAIDIGRLVYERQNLANALDAAAQAGALSLPNTTDANTKALAFAASNGAGVTPNVYFWCLVPSASGAVDTSEIPASCYPGSGPYTVGSYYGTTGRIVSCNAKICAIPCPSGNSCNTISVSATKMVDYYFAPVIGYYQGSTGALVSNACKGPCGGVSPNPMDVVVVADRTGSMSDANRNLMISAIKGMLLTMNDQQQYVSFGTIGRSKTPINTTCPSTTSTSETSGPWVPVKFSNDYNVEGATVTANTSSSLYKAVNCLTASSTGTYLASSFKAAARYVLGYDGGSSDLSALGARTGVVSKAIIFETDGQPNENKISGSTTISVSGDIGSSTASTACTNFSTLATNAKAAGVLVVTVAFGDANTATCGTKNVRDVLAAAASPMANGTASDADGNCSTAALRDAENSDGDYFFCADTSSASSLAPIFKTAMSQLSGNTRLIQIPS